MTPPTQREAELREQLMALTPPYISSTDKISSHQDTVAEVAKLGLTHADVPILREMVGNYELEDSDEDEYNFELGLPVLAARALASLRALDALDDVLAMLEPMDRMDDDVLTESMGVTLAGFGREALPRFEAYLDEGHLLWANCAVIRAMTELARAEPDLRDRAIGVLVRRLQLMRDNDPELNGEYVAGLLDMKAKEAALTIEQAYAAGRVPLIAFGNWNSVKEQLGVPGTGLVPDEVASQDPKFDQPFGQLHEQWAQIDELIAAKRRQIEAAEKAAAKAAAKAKRQQLDRQRKTRRGKSR